MTVIYALTDPRIPEAVRYVGVTRQKLSIRLIAHVHTAKYGGHLPVHRWIKKLLDAGVRPLATVVEETEDRMREKHWMLHYAKQGMRLLNCAEANGDAMTLTAERKAQIRAVHLGAKRSDLCRARMSAALKGKPATNFPRGFHHSEETKRKLSEKSRGRVLSPEHGAKVSAALKGKPKSPGHRAAVIAANVGKKRSAEARANISAGRKLQVRGPQKRRSHCSYGHLMAGDNLHVSPKTGYHKCRACCRRRTALYEARKKRDQS
jgi:hypothetical protein